MSITRRVFLRNGGLAVIGTAAIPSFLTRAAYATQSLSAQNKRLVVIFQRGAADGLNIVVPHGEQRLLRHAPVHQHSAQRGPRSRRILRTPSHRSRPSSRCGSSATWQSFTPPARPTPRARTSTRRTSWNPARPA